MVIRRNAAEFLAQLLRSMRLTLDRDTKKANSYQLECLEMRSALGELRDFEVYELRNENVFRGRLASLAKQAPRASGV